MGEIGDRLIDNEINLLLEVTQSCRGRELPYHLPSANWRMRKAQVNSVGVRRLESQEHLRPRAGEDECPRWTRRKICPSSTFLFYLDHLGCGWCRPVLVKVILFPQLADSDDNVSKSTFTETPRDNVFPAVGTIPLAWQVIYGELHLHCGMNLTLHIRGMLGSQNIPQLWT